jgi:hypothetical protein
MKHVSSVHILSQAMLHTSYQYTSIGFLVIQTTCKPLLLKFLLSTLFCFTFFEKLLVIPINLQFFLPIENTAGRE